MVCTISGCAAVMTWTGAPSASAATQFNVIVLGIESFTQGIVFYGTGGALDVPWSARGGFQCVKAPLQRTTIQAAGGSAFGCEGRLQLDWNVFIASNPNALGAPFSTGNSVWLQSWSRDPLAVKASLLSNALQFQLAP